MDEKIIKKRLEQGIQAREWWVKQATKSYNYTQWNKQWPGGTDFDKNIHLTFNRIAPYLNFVVGLYAESKLAVEIGGREEADMRLADVFRSVFDFVVDEDNTHDKALDAIEDCMTCGMGYLKELVTVDGNLQPMVFSEVIDPFSIVLDWNARHPPDDLSWLIELRKVPVEVAEYLFPDVKIHSDTVYQTHVEEQGGESREGGHSINTSDYTGESERKDATEEEGSVTITEMWYKKEELGEYRVEDTPLGPLPSPLEAKPKEGESILRHTLSDIWVATMVGDELVQDEPSRYDHPALKEKTFPYWFFLGHRLRGVPYHVGAPYLLFDQQDMYNKLNSLTIDSAIRNKNLGWMGRKGTLTDDEQAKLVRYGSEPNVYVEYNNEPPQQNAPVPLSRAYVDLADRVAMSFDEMSSWRDINRGSMPYETSGRGIMALQRQTAQSHARIERNVRSAFMRGGKMRFSNIHQFLPLVLISRITDKLSETAQGEGDLELDARALLDQSLGRYDIKFTIGVGEERNKAQLAEQFIALHDRGAVDAQALLQALDVPGWKGILDRVNSQNQALQMGQSVLGDENLSALVQMVQQDPNLLQAIIAMLQNQGGQGG